MDWKNIFIIGIIGFLAWYFLIRKEAEPQIAEDPKTETVVQSQPSSKSSSQPVKPSVELPAVRIFRYLDANLDNILSPMDDPRGKEISASEIFSIQSSIRSKLATTKDEKERRMYSYANSICQQIHNAISERERHNDRLADTRSKPSKSLSDPKKNDDFFEKSIKSIWEDKAKSLRADIQKSRDYLRDL